PRIGRAARAGGAARCAARAAARIDEAVRHLIFVDGLRCAAHVMNSVVATYSVHSRVSGNPGAAVRDPGFPLSRERTERGVNGFSNGTRVVRYSGKSLRQPRRP